jgi:hypothetical protein
LAKLIAENLIEATSKTSEIVTITSGVGGPIHTFLLNGAEAKELR